MKNNLDTPVQFLKGVGPRIAEILARKEIHTIGDVLRWFPRSFEDRRSVKSIRDLQPGTLSAFTAQVIQTKTTPLGRTNRKMNQMILADSTGSVTAKWFHVPFPKFFEPFKPGSQVRVVGVLKQFRSQKEIHHPEIKLAEQIESESGQNVFPIYSETEGLNQSLIRKIIKSAIESSADQIEETLPQWILEKHNLPGLRESLIKVHNPDETDFKDWIECKTQFQKRLIFEEFFWLEMILARNRAGIILEKGPKIKADLKLSQNLRKLLPFSLTEGQEKVLAEITEDLLKNHPMQRLVQGDVGCGKTIVAFLSAAIVIQNGFQVALMAPTEILAEQHFKKANELFSKLGIDVCLLTGAMNTSDANAARSKIKTGTSQLVIGTHALIQNQVEFHKLGLVIVDEQHRFGVKQRSDLKQKGISPHFLVMTATPIPRTLAMTVYGDLDFSVIREMPQGRQPIVTRFVYENKSEQVYQFVKDLLLKGQQAYIVFPLVEETEKLDLKNATDMHAVLSQKLAPLKVGLLHGRLTSKEKDFLMNEFRSGKISALVSTTVIEVGVDVPNATVMVVEHAERFGLSQLHQLRGRVGRGTLKSYCILVAKGGISDMGKQRLEVMTQTTDGFKIAEEDLELRGPGEFLGTKQSGVLGFKIANLIRDAEILSQARNAAWEVTRRDPSLSNNENKPIRSTLNTEKKSQQLFATIG